MGHLHMRIQALESTNEKHPDIDLEDKRKMNVVFCKTVKARYTHIYTYVSPPLQAGGTNTSM